MSTVHETIWSLLCGRGIRLARGLRGAVLGAVAAEHDRAEEEAAREEEKDIFERLPEPVHLDHGDVKYTDGKLRYLD